MYVDNITYSLQGIKTYQGKNMRTGFFMVISHMFISKSLANEQLLHAYTDWISVES